MVKKNKQADKSLTQTWTSSHVYGHCLAHHPTRLLYVHIPKCASMWVRQYLKHCLHLNDGTGWDGANFTDPDLQDYRAIVILRDPIDRWISACPGIRPGASPDDFGTPVLDSLETAVKSLSAMTWDEHVHPQTNFIKGLKKQPIYIRCDQQVGPSLRRLLNKFAFKVPDLIPAVNTSRDMPDRLPYQQAWREICKLPMIQTAFREIYKHDYELIQRASFYT